VIQSDTALATARYRRLRLAPDTPSASQATSETRAAVAPEVAYVLSLEQRRQRGLAGMVERHIRARVVKHLEADRDAWVEVNSRPEWERFRDPRINALRRWLGEFPVREPLNTVVTKEYRGSGYRRQDLAYRSRPGLWVAANFYLPDKPVARMPAIVIVPSHHRPRTQAELQDMGILWSRVGAAVLIIDNLGHGERIQTYPWNREGYRSRYTTGMQLYIAGESLMKWMVWDLMRGIDLLLERPDIDKDRVIMLGAVAGGGDPPWRHLRSARPLRNSDPAAASSLASWRSRDGEAGKPRATSRGVSWTASSPGRSALRSRPAGSSTRTKWAGTWKRSPHGRDIAKSSASTARSIIWTKRMALARFQVRESAPT
jgi:hypothetical protein